MDRLSITTCLARVSLASYIHIKSWYVSQRWSHVDLFKEHTNLTFDFSYISSIKLVKSNLKFFLPGKGGMPQGRTSSTTSCFGMLCTFSKWRRMFVTCWGNISRDSCWFVSVFLSPHMFIRYGWNVPAQPSNWHHRSPASLACSSR